MLVSFDRSPFSSFNWLWPEGGGLKKGRRQFGGYEWTYRDVIQSPRLRLIIAEIITKRGSQPASNCHSNREDNLDERHYYFFYFFHPSCRFQTRPVSVGRARYTRKSIDEDGLQNTGLLFC